MHFLYLDGSGDIGQYHPAIGGGSQFRYYVLGGFALASRHWYPLKQDLERVLRNYFPSGPLPEVHFSQIRRRKPPFNHINSATLMDDLVGLVANSPAILFAMVVDKHRYQMRYHPPDPIPTFCLDAMASRFQEYLQRARDEGAIVSDRTSHASDDVLMKAFESMKANGTQFVQVSRIMDTVFFTPSETAIGIQLADIVGNVVFRRYERNDRTYFSRIYRSFDSSGGQMHGLRVFPP